MTGWWLASYIVLWVFLVLLVFVLLVVLRQLGLIYIQAQAGGIRLDEGPVLGSSIPVFEAVDEISGEAFVFPSGEAELSLLIFVSPNCSICEEAIRGVDLLAKDHGVGVLVVSNDGERSDQLRGLVEPPARFIASPQRHQLLAIQSTPQAIVVDGKGVVVEKTIVNRFEHVQELLDRSAAQLSMSRRSTPSGQRIFASLRR